MKKALLTAIATLAFASTAFAAAPAMDLAAGQAQLGYSYNNLDTTTPGWLNDLGNYKASGLSLGYGISDKIAVTGDYLGSESKNFNVYNNGVYQGTVTGVKYGATELGLQYQVTPNIAVLAGNVKSELKDDTGSISANEMYGGVALRQNLADKVNGYASFLKSTNVEDWKAGMTYNFTGNTSFDLGYRSFKNSGSGSVEAKGVSFGLNQKF